MDEPDKVKLKKLLLEQSIEAVPEAVGKVIDWLTNEPDTVNEPEIAVAYFPTETTSKEFNKVFGGYTDIPWSKPGNFGVSKTGGGKSLIFSVSD